MKASRKLKLVLYSLIMILIVVNSASTEEFKSEHFNVEKLTDGVFGVIHSFGGYAICNSGIIDLGEKVLIFDTFLTIEAANDLQKAAEFYTGKKVTYVINSHAHNDHIRGNQVFHQNSIIISTKNIRDKIEKEEPGQIQYEKEHTPDHLSGIKTSLSDEVDEKKREEMQMWIGYYEGMIQSHSELKTILPELTFEDNLTIHGSDRSAELRVYSNAHTTEDIVLFLPEDKILFAGDLVFNKMHPYIPDGNPEKWKAALEDLLAKDIENVVPGHGEVGKIDIIQTMIDYINFTDKLANELHEKGTPIEEFNFENIPDPFTTWNFPRFFRMNMNFMYKRLE